MRSRLTVIIPAYNEVDSIIDTVRSIQNQTLAPDDIIVVDDGSTDSTGEAARTCGVTVRRAHVNHRCLTHRAARDHADFHFAVDAGRFRNLRGRDVLISRGHHFVFCGPVHPQLKTVHHAAAALEFVRRHFGMHDAAPGGHPLHVAAPRPNIITVL